MREIIESMFEVADWFVMEGADLHYGDDIDPDELGPRPPYIHEARFSDLQVFIGEPVTAHHPGHVVEVAVSLRTGIPLAAEVVDDSVTQLRFAAPSGVTIEVFDGDATGSGTAVWATVFLDRADVETGAFAGVVANLLGFARSCDAQTI